MKQKASAYLINSPILRGSTALQLHKFFSQVETKTRKLRKLFAKLQAVKQDITEVTEEHNRDRRDLEDTQEQLLKELKLKVIIIENFIPPNERKKLLSRAVYDQVYDCI